MTQTRLIVRIMKAVTVQETESIRPTSIETTHTTIHIKDKHYLQFYAALGFFLSALPRVKQMSMFMQNQHQQISQQLSLLSSLPPTAYLTK
jgi:hypothetical protein